MIQVWKCDHCHETSINSIKILEHEPKCSFNPINRNCHTCKYSFESGWDGCHEAGCDKNLDANKGERYGNCDGWETDDPEYLRKLKLEKINQKLKDETSLEV